MGVNYYFKEGMTEKFLLITVYRDGDEHVHGEYSDLKSLATALSWVRHPNSFNYRIKKVKVSVEDINMSQEEEQYILEVANKKNIKLIRSNSTFVQFNNVT
jgi:hypothetical protein